MFTHKRLVFILPILAMLLTLPSLWVGFGLDDWYQRVVLLENRDLELLPKVMMELFVFMDGDPQRTRGLMDVGILRIRKVKRGTAKADCRLEAEPD